ncbi:MAG: hypothetical protein L6R39_002464 [Caloplaca ligustica]|nr:MAG: hypothetical protein L6R39_002464 [Caloplaca ligustica]
MAASRSMSVSKAQDEGRLAELGYTQELRREWSLLHNFGASFSIISFTSVERTLTERRLFSYGLNTGGPGVMSIGWIIVSIFSTHLPRYVGKDG